jgi:proteasome lid subunit RPN8/RPN11
MSAKGSSVHLEMTHDTWKEMLDSADKLLEQSPQRELQIIGWYHTHPNGLQVFMSGTDRDTQSRMFAHDWQFAVVLNPQKQRWRAFFGHTARECKGYVIADEEGEESDAKLLPAVAPEKLEEQPAALEDGWPPAEGDVRTRKRAVKGLMARVKRPRLLLWACMLSLLLVLFLQCVIVVLQVVDLIVR